MTQEIIFIREVTRNVINYHSDGTWR